MQLCLPDSVLDKRLSPVVLRSSGGSTGTGDQKADGGVNMAESKRGAGIAAASSAVLPGAANVPGVVAAQPQTADVRVLQELARKEAGEYFWMVTFCGDVGMSADDVRGVLERQRLQHFVADSGRLCNADPSLVQARLRELLGSKSGAAPSFGHVILGPDKCAVITKILEHRVRDGRFQANVVYGAKSTKCWKDVDSLDPDAQAAMLQTKLVPDAPKRRAKQSDTSIRVQKEKKNQLRNEKRKTAAGKARKSAENKRGYQRRKKNKAS